MKSSRYILVVIPVLVASLLSDIPSLAVEKNTKQQGAVVFMYKSNTDKEAESRSFNKELVSVSLASTSKKYAVNFKLTEHSSLSSDLNKLRRPVFDLNSLSACSKPLKTVQLLSIYPFHHFW
jgi:hypothetical protein